MAFVYAGDRATSSPAQHLAGYRGVLQTDGYGAYKALAKGGAVELAFCWTHTRRYFHKLLDEKNPAKTPISAEAIARIQQLYAVEDEIRGRSADDRRAVRQAKSAPLLADLKPWLSARLELISQKGDLAKAIRYVLNHWEGLTRLRIPVIVGTDSTRWWAPVPRDRGRLGRPTWAWSHVWMAPPRHVWMAPPRQPISAQEPSRQRGLPFPGGHGSPTDGW